MEDLLKARFLRLLTSFGLTLLTKKAHTASNHVLSCVLS
jgi:hypothetical protein